MDGFTELPAVPSQVTAVAWAANDLFGCACQDGGISLNRRGSETLSSLLTLRHDGPDRALQFLDCGKRLAVLLSGERGVRLWHLDRLNERLQAMSLGF